MLSLQRVLCGNRLIVHLQPRTSARTVIVVIVGAVTTVDMQRWHGRVVVGGGCGGAREVLIM